MISDLLSKLYFGVDQRNKPHCESDLISGGCLPKDAECAAGITGMFVLRTKFAL